jgi:hypothetical protein
MGRQGAPCDFLQARQRLNDAGSIAEPEMGVLKINMLRVFAYVLSEEF